jgi:hypothetical protein
LLPAIARVALTLRTALLPLRAPIALPRRGRLPAFA